MFLLTPPLEPTGKAPPLSCNCYPSSTLKPTLLFIFHVGRDVPSYLEASCPIRQELPISSSFHYKSLSLRGKNTCVVIYFSAIPGLLVVKYTKFVVLPCSRYPIDDRLRVNPRSGSPTRPTGGITAYPLATFPRPLPDTFTPTGGFGSVYVRSTRLFPLKRYVKNRPYSGFILRCPWPGTSLTAPMLQMTPTTRVSSAPTAGNGIPPTTADLMSVPSLLPSSPPSPSPPPPPSSSSVSSSHVVTPVSIKQMSPSTTTTTTSPSSSSSSSPKMFHHLATCFSAAPLSAPSRSPYITTSHRASSSLLEDRSRRTPTSSHPPSMNICSSPAKHSLDVQLPTAIRPEMVTISANKGDKLKVVADAWHMETDCEFPVDPRHMDFR